MYIHETDCGLFIHLYYFLQQSLRHMMKGLLSLNLKFSHYCSVIVLFYNIIIFECHLYKDMLFPYFKRTQGYQSYLHVIDRSYMVLPRFSK